LDIPIYIGKEEEKKGRREEEGKKGKKINLIILYQKIP
jgi:hypothetical protein